MVIVLSNLEKKSFFSFLTLYIGSSLFLILVISSLYFDSVSTSIFEAQKDKMRSYASSLASKVIHAHMQSTTFEYKNNTNYKIAMYSKKLNLLYGDELENINFEKVIYQKDNALYLVDQSAQLHLGVKYIVLKDSTIFHTIATLKKTIIAYTILAIVFVSIIGYFLGRLFLTPISNERERLDRFIKDTTHELNTPITALLMSTSSLKDENSKVINRINISAKRISNIYNDLCYLLKSDIKHSPTLEELNIKDIINEQITLLDSYAKSKKITMETNLENLTYKIDKESSVRLINNIISNALKYSKPNSTVKITIHENIFTVYDNGVGINQKDLHRITERYYRANKSEGGFGIGLDIVNSICNKYNIKLTINSKEDIGSTVTLSF